MADREGSRGSFQRFLAKVQRNGSGALWEAGLLSLKTLLLNWSCPGNIHALNRHG